MWSTLTRLASWASALRIHPAPRLPRLSCPVPRASAVDFPQYSTEEVMRQRMLTAIEHGLLGVVNF